MRWSDRIVSCLVLALISGVILMGGGGCALTKTTTGQPIVDENVKQIVKGRTTVDDVITMFGVPTRQSEIAGNVLYTYRYVQTKSQTVFFPYVTSGNATEEADELTITFDKASGTVKAFNLTRGIGRT